MHKCHCDIYPIFGANEQHAYFSVSVSTHCIQHSVCILFISFKKDEHDESTKKKRIESKRIISAREKKRSEKSIINNKHEQFSCFSCSYCYSFLACFRLVVLVACFALSLCAFAYPSASSQFICRLLLAVHHAVQTIYAHTTSSHAYIVCIVRCNIVFIVCTAQAHCTYCAVSYFYFHQFLVCSFDM